MMNKTSPLDDGASHIQANALDPKSLLLSPKPDDGSQE